MKGFLNSFKYALKGIRLSVKQRNMRIHLLCALAVILLGFYFKIKIGEWCILFLCIALVLSLEIINTAIEHLVDLVSPDRHATAEKIKDLAAGAVLVSAIITAVIGAVIFYKYVLALI